MRNYGEVPPVLSTASAPGVSSTTGLGVGGGAGVFSKGTPSDGQGFGTVEIVTGTTVGGTGQVVLTFAQQPPILFIAADDTFGPLTVTNNDGAHLSVTIAWGVKLPPGTRLRIHYEWASSK